MIGETEARPDVLDVVGDRLDGPVHHRQHVPAPWRLALLRFAVTDVERAVPAELASLRVPPEVDHVQLGCLGPAKSPTVDDLEEGGVTVGGEGSLALGIHGACDLVVGVVEEPLQFFAGERPRFRITLVILQVREGVPFVSDGHRKGAEGFLACRAPAVAGVDEELGEQPNRALVAADRGRRQVLLARQRGRPLVHVGRRPLPRVLVREIEEPADQPFPRVDRFVLQPPRLLLSPPPPQHRVEHRVLRTQLDHPGNELQVSRAGEGHLLLMHHSRPSLLEGRYCIRWDRAGKLPAQGVRS